MVSKPSLYTVKKDSMTKTIKLPVAVACQTFALTNSIHFFVSILFSTQKLTQKRTATAEMPATASISSLPAPEISIRNSATNHVIIVNTTASNTPKYTCFLNRSFLDASKYVKIAPSIRADSKPSLNMIEKEEENAIEGATTPVPDTRRS